MRPTRPSPQHKWVTTKAVYDKDGNLLHEEGYWYLGPWSLAVAMNTNNFNAYRFYDSDGGEAASTQLEAQDTDITLNVDSDATIQLRVRIDEVGGADGSSMDDYQLEYSKNSGTFTALTGTDSGDGIQAATAGLTNDGATTNRSTDGISDPGGGSFVAGEQSTDGTVDDMAITANNFTELVFGIQFNNANVANGDTFDFEFTSASAVANNNVVPTVTIEITPPTAESPAAYVPRPKANYSRFSVEDKTNLGGRAHRPSYPITPHKTFPGSPGFKTRILESRKLRDAPRTLPWLLPSGDVNVGATAAALTIATGTASIGYAALAASLYRPPTLRSVQQRRHLSAKQLPWWSIDQEVTATAATLTIATGTATVGLADLAASLHRPPTLKSEQKREHLSARQLPWWSIDQEVAATAATLTITTGTAQVGFADLAASLYRPPTHKSGFERNRKDPLTIEWFVFNDVTVNATAASLTITTGTATIGVADLAASLHRPAVNRARFDRKQLTLPTIPWFVPSDNVEVNANAAALTITTGTAVVGVADLAASLHRPPTLKSGLKREHLSAKQLPWWSIDVEVSATAQALTITTGTATITFTDDVQGGREYPKAHRTAFKRTHKRLPTLEWFAPSDVEISATAAQLTITTGTATVTFASGGKSRRPWDERPLSPVVRIDLLRKEEDELLLKIIEEFLDRQGRLALVEKPSSDESV